MLDFFLPRVRKEPHLGSLLTFESDCDAPVGQAVPGEPPGHLQLYQLSEFRQVPAIIICLVILSPVDAVQNSLTLGFVGNCAPFSLHFSRATYSNQRHPGLRRRAQPSRRANSKQAVL